MQFHIFLLLASPGIKIDPPPNVRDRVKNLKRADRPSAEIVAAAVGNCPVYAAAGYFDIESPFVE